MSTSVFCIIREGSLSAGRCTGWRHSDEDPNTTSGGSGEAGPSAPGIADQGTSSRSEERLRVSDGFGTWGGDAGNLESFLERVEVEVLWDFTVPDA